MHIILKTSLYFFLLLFVTQSWAETPKPDAASVEQAAESVQDEQASEDSAEVTSDSESVAEPKQYYIVEVILFRHLNEEGKLDEFWHQPDSLAEDDNAASELTSDPMLQTTPSLTDDTPALAQYDLISQRFLPLRNGVATLSSSNYKLADSAAHLRYSKDFQLLAHFGWTQRSLSKHNALPVVITSDQFSDSMKPSGHLKLYVSRYLHMQVDLATSVCEQTESVAPEVETISDRQLDEKLENGTSTLEKTDAAANERLLANTETITPQPRACVNNTYLFKQQRKMRSKELHYLDNPVYGMLVYVTPFTAEEQVQPQKIQ